MVHRINFWNNSADGSFNMQKENHIAGKQLIVCPGLTSRKSDSGIRSSMYMILFSGNFK